MNTLVIFSLVLLGISTVVAITEETGRARSLTRPGARAVILGLQTLIASIPSTGPRHSPGSWHTEIEDGGNPFVYLRVWYFSPSFVDGDSCSTTPTISPALPTYLIVRSLNNLLRAIERYIEYYGYDYYTAIQGEFGVEYVLEEAIARPRARHQAQVVDHQQTAQVIKPNVNADCFPFHNSLVSGNHMSLFSTLHSGSSLASPNGKYTLTMESPLCKLVLKDSDSVTIWASQSSYTVDGCYAVMQLDCNLVVYTPLKSTVWASQTMVCYGCVSSCVMVVQSDGNVVVYNSESGAPLWASHTNV